VASGARSRGREEYGLEFSRIVAFSDGVFAIAITLLVLQLDVPLHAGSGHELATALRGDGDDLLAFGISFAVIGRFWWRHHAFYGEVVRFDARLVAFNFTYLAFVVLIPFTSDLLGRYGDQSVAVAIYAIDVALVILVSVGMVEYALRAGLTREGMEDEIRRGRNGALYAAAVFLASIPIAFVAPSQTPLFWLLLVLDPTDRRGRHRAPS